MRTKGNTLQFIKFVFVGISNTCISEGVYAVLIFMGIHYIPSSFIGFSLSVVNAYYWNARYVFKEDPREEKRVWWKVLCKTYLAYSWGYLANVLLLVFWIDIIGISRFLIPLEEEFLRFGAERLTAEFLGNLTAAGLNLLITVPLNFLVNKYWAYKQRKVEEDKSGS